MKKLTVVVASDSLVRKRRGWTHLWCLNSYIIHKQVQSSTVSCADHLVQQA